VVVDVRGDKVRLGLTAPPEVQIVRDDAGSQEPRNRESR
jgi:sRNA-binding carbon storage regulator CsrA